MKDTLSFHSRQAVAPTLRGSARHQHHSQQAARDAANTALLVVYERAGADS